MSLKHGIDITLTWRPREEGKPASGLGSWRVLTSDQDWGNVADSREEAVASALARAEKIADEAGRLLP